MSDLEELTTTQAEFMERLRELDEGDSWLLFVNAGFTMEDAKALFDKGMIDTSRQMGMPAARLKPAPGVELLPCPFCASLASLQCHGGIFEGAPGWRIECAGPCHAMTCYWHTKPQAIEAWNRRSPPAQAVQ